MIRNIMIIDLCMHLNTDIHFVIHDHLRVLLNNQLLEL
jgi:hypothetical protein